MNYRELVLALVGYQGSGKSTLAQHLVRERGFFAFEGSGYIREHARKAGQTLDERADYEAHYADMVKELGASCLTDAMLNRPENRLVYSGLRTRPNFYRLKQVGGIVVALECPPEDCLTHINAANPTNPLSLPEYLASRRIEDGSSATGSQTEWVIKQADYAIDASRPLEEVSAELIDLVDTCTN